MLIFADENIKSFTMEEQKTTDLTTEKLSKAQRTIAVVLAEIQGEGHSKIMPFDIGGVEIRMLRYAAINGITLGSDRLYMSAKQLTHAIRQSKRCKGLAVDLIELINFPTARFKMELYYDKECFIYTNGISKFIVHPNYEIKISRGKVKVVNFITATKIKDPAEFTLPKYIKI